MISEKMKKLGQKRSTIREIFEYGNKRKKEIGAQNVYDFSLGNPSIPAPKIVEETIENLLRKKGAVALHGYTSAQGDLATRENVASYITNTFNAKCSPNNIYMTCGAAASLTILWSPSMAITSRPLSTSSRATALPYRPRPKTAYVLFFFIIHSHFSDFIGTVCILVDVC